MSDTNLFETKRLYFKKKPKVIAIFLPRQDDKESCPIAFESEELMWEFLNEMNAYTVEIFKHDYSFKYDVFTEDAMNYCGTVSSIALVQPDTIMDYIHHDEDEPDEDDDEIIPFDETDDEVGTTDFVNFLVHHGLMPQNMKIETTSPEVPPNPAFQSTRTRLGEEAMVTKPDIYNKCDVNYQVKRFKSLLEYNLSTGATTQDIVNIIFKEMEGVMTRREVVDACQIHRDFVKRCIEEDYTKYGC